VHLVDEGPTENVLLKLITIDLLIIAGFNGKVQVFTSQFDGLKFS